MLIKKKDWFNIWTTWLYSAVPSWEHTGTHDVLYKGAQNNNLTCDRIFLTNKTESTPIFISVGGRVMRKLCLTNPPLHLPDCRSDKSPLIWKIVLSRKCDWFMHRMSVSHNAAAAGVYVWSEDEFLSAGLSSSQEVWDCLWVGVDKRVAGDRWPGFLTCLRCC